MDMVFQNLWKSRCHYLGYFFHLIWKNYVRYWDWLKKLYCGFFSLVSLMKKDHKTTFLVSVENNYCTIWAQHFLCIILGHFFEVYNFHLLHYNGWCTYLAKSQWLKKIFYEEYKLGEITSLIASRAKNKCFAEILLEQCNLLCHEKKCLEKKIILNFF